MIGGLFGLGVATVVLFVGFGACIGLLFGLFGMGGSFLVTPALLVSGYPARVAVGSGLAFVFGTSVIATLRHRNFGQIDYRLAALMLVGMTAGIEGGKRALVRFEAVGTADVIVSLAYVGLLTLAGGFVLFDSRDRRVRPRSSQFVAHVERVRVPPRVRLVGDHVVSVWVILVAGLAVGVLSGFMGVGGGFLLLPVMLYGLGVPLTVAVGTDILQITVSSAYGAYVFAQADAIALPAVGTMLAGSAFGARVGAAATTLVDEGAVKGYFAVLLLAGSGSIGANALGHHVGLEALSLLALVLLFGTPVLVCGLIVRATWRELKDDTGTARPVSEHRYDP